MNLFAIAVISFMAISFMAISIVVIIIIFHDQNVITAKERLIIRNIRANETCTELKGDIAFTDKENQGLWLKYSYDDEVLKQIKEKHCS